MPILSDPQDRRRSQEQSLNFIQGIYLAGRCFSA